MSTLEVKSVGEVKSAGNYLPASTIGKREGLPPEPVPARDWIKVLARYRKPNQIRSLIEIAITLAPFVVLWLCAWAALSVGYWLTLLIVVPTAGFLLRLFLIQHDCGHGSFFARRAVNDWIGRALGILTLTPYDVWRRSHAVHHASAGNLAKRGIGDVATLTVAEYRALPWWRQLGYRLYRDPIVMFGLGPAYLFFLQNRLPFGLMDDGWRVWVSAMGTNFAIIAGGAIMIAIMGAGPFLMVHIPVILLAATIGVWLFYVQHQFEDTVWADGEEWQFPEAAMHGSSYYVLPPVLSWFTANIGVHHVHHLCSKIPYYRLPAVLREHPELANVRPLTLWKSFSAVRLKLWDEQAKRLVTFREARETAAARGTCAAGQDTQGHDVKRTSFPIRSSKD